MVNFRYIIVSQKDWTEEEITKLNKDYIGTCKWIYGD